MNVTFLEKQIAVTSKESGSWVLFTFWSIAFILFLTIQGHPMVFLGKLDRYCICPCIFFFFYFVSMSDLCSTILAYSNRYVAHKNPRKKKNECHSVCFSLFLSLLSRLYAVVYLGRKMSIWKKSLDDSILPLKLCPSTQFISCLLCLFSVRMHFRPDLWCQLVAAAFFSIHCWSNNTTSDIYAHK